MPKFNIMIIGPPNVGKSSLIFFNKYLYFSQNNDKLKNLSYTMNILHQVLDIHVYKYDKTKLFQEEWKYYITSQLVIIMFDLTDVKSFFKAKQLFMKFEKYNYGKKDYILLGNKTDLHSQIKIQEDLIKKHFNESIYYIEISIKIDFCLHKVYKKIKNKMIRFLRNQNKDKRKKKRFCDFLLC